jgi:hypothetical protein
MPFDTPYRDYEEGDFIFGIAEDITEFKKGPALGHLSTVKNTDRTPITVRELSLEPSRVDSIFGGDRKVFNNAYLVALRNYDKYHMYNRAHDKNTEQMTSVDSNAVFRAKSKAGLLYCMQSNIYVNFVLDSLILTEVMGKSRSNDFKNSPDDKFRNVTGAELRWIYRYKNAPECKALIQFWVNGQKCCPPWEAGYKTFVATAPDWTYVPSNPKDSLEPG